MSPTNPRMRASGSPPPASSLAVVRIALLMGVLMFGAVTYYIQRGANWEPAAPDVLNTLHVVVLVVLVLAVVLLLVLRMRPAPHGHTAGRPMLILPWAIGEAAALFGGVYYFLSGNAQWFIIGLFVMLASFILFPIRRT
ncbi:MAG TPA: hypothetical protein VMM77_07750 [Gemmatimonadaceae bacterium]|nr:hypothetical protein [Gemmatimonadaceae bacterium]